MAMVAVTMENNNTRVEEDSQIAMETLYPWCREKPKSGRRGCLFWCLTVVVIFIIFCTTTIVGLYFAFKPHAPLFVIQSFNVSSFYLMDNNLTANWFIFFSVKNPNKLLSLAYETPESFIRYKDDNLSRTSMDSFQQGTRSENIMETTFSVEKHFVGSLMAESMELEMKDGQLIFNVRVSSRVRYGYRGNRWKVQSMNVYCEGLEVELDLNGGTAGTLVGDAGSRECLVRFS